MERLTPQQYAALAHINENGGVRVLSRLGSLSYPDIPFRRDVVDRLLDEGLIRTKDKPRMHHGPRGGIEHDVVVTYRGRDRL